MARQRQMMLPPGPALRRKGQIRSRSQVCAAPLHAAQWYTAGLCPADVCSRHSACMHCPPADPLDPFKRLTQAHCAAGQAWSVSFAPLDPAKDDIAAAEAWFNEGFPEEAAFQEVAQPAAAPGHAALGTETDARDSSSAAAPGTSVQREAAATDPHRAQPGFDSEGTLKPSMSEEHKRTILGAMQNIKMSYIPRWAKHVPEEAWTQGAIQQLQGQEQRAALTGMNEPHMTGSVPD